ncbi:MAG: aminotransferase class I/II-fold pyridoxal phosphate-dependent enzyme [Syntrophomonas sp.]
MNTKDPEELTAPFWSSLLKYRGEDNLRLHMPGHVGGRGLPEAYLSLAELDLTEVPGIDDLHQPRSDIKEALLLMARAYRAGESFFLVNGATSGIHALFMSLPGENPQVLVPRNAHRSLWGGMVLSGAVPRYLSGGYDVQTGIPLALDPDIIGTELEADPQIRAVFLTSPSYFGTSLNIAEMASLAHQRGAVLLVDEAHGAHFAFHPAYPRPALSQGADAAVNGLHKTLPVLNQGACLHIGREYKYRDQLAAALSLITTTSPSFPLLASMDLARQFMQAKGYEHLEKAHQTALKYRAMMDKIPGMRVVTPSGKNDRYAAGQDPLKVTLHIAGIGLNSPQMADVLRREYHIQPELAQPGLIMFMFSLFHREDEWERLYLALAAIAAKYGGAAGEPEIIPPPPMPRMVLSPRQAFWQERRRVKLKDSLGLLSAEMAAPYPPGIPCLLPGELIDAETLEYLWYIKQRGLYTQGPHDPALDYIMVLDETGKGLE